MSSGSCVSITSLTRSQKSKIDPQEPEVSILLGCYCGIFMGLGIFVVYRSKYESIKFLMIFITFTNRILKYYISIVND